MNEEIIQDVLKLNVESGFVRHNGIRITGVEHDSCRVEVKLEPHHYNIWGMPHGGLIFAMADMAAGALARAHGRAPCVTVDVSISYLSAAGAGATEIYACSKSLREGRTLCFYDVCVYDNLGHQLAAAHITMKRISK